MYSAYSIKVPRALAKEHLWTCIHTSGVAVRNMGFLHLRLVLVSKELLGVTGYSNGLLLGC